MIGFIPYLHSWLEELGKISAIKIPPTCLMHILCINFPDLIWHVKISILLLHRQRQSPVLQLLPV